MKKDRILIFSCVGDDTSNYLDWVIKSGKDFDSAVVYYGSNQDTAKMLEKSTVFFRQEPGFLFPSFAKYFEDLSDYDYYLIVDDDIEFSINDLLEAIRILKINNIHSGSFSHSKTGKLTYDFLAHEEGGAKYRVVNFTEENFTIVSNRLMRYTVKASRRLGIRYSVGWTLVLANCGYHFDMYGSLIFNEFVMRNPPDIEKNSKQRSIESAYEAIGMPFWERENHFVDMINNNIDFFSISIAWHRTRGYTSKIDPGIINDNIALKE